MEKLSSRVNCFSRRWKGQLQPSTPLLGSHASHNTRPTQSESSQRLWAMHWLYGRPSVDRAHIGEGGNLPAIDANVELCPFKFRFSQLAEFFWSSRDRNMQAAEVLISQKQTVNEVSRQCNCKVQGLCNKLGGLVLSCAEADVCKWSLVQYNVHHFSRWIRCTHFYTAPNSKFREILTMWSIIVSQISPNLMNSCQLLANFSQTVLNVSKMLANCFEGLTSLTKYYKYYHQ